MADINYPAQVGAQTGSAVSDLFSAQAYGYKAQGAQFEKQNYDLAAQFAEQNVAYTAAATSIKQAQNERQLFQSQGQTEADVAGAGFAASGSALDILRDSASQGALTKAVASQQGMITEAGYQEQADSYHNMSSAAQVAIDAAHTAQTGAYISAGIHSITAIAELAAL